MSERLSSFIMALCLYRRWASRIRQEQKSVAVRTDGGARDMLKRGGSAVEESTDDAKFRLEKQKEKNLLLKEKIRRRKERGKVLNAPPTHAWSNPWKLEEVMS